VQTPSNVANNGSNGHTLEIAHILFMDIVAYSQLPMDEQTRLTRVLQEVVRTTNDFARAEKQGQLLRLPTGDGMALVFFGDAEAPTRCAVEISKSLRSHPDLKLRIGIHAGPVHRVEDINAAKNVAGAGINLAQRVMDCGDAGHILVSKSVAEVLGEMRIWRPMLHDVGIVSVKHGVRIHIYNLYTDDAGNREVPKKLLAVSQIMRLSRVRPEFSRKLWICIIGIVFAIAAFSLRKLGNRATISSISIAQDVPSLKQGKYVAVLPLKKVNNEKLVYLADGIQESLIARLFQIKNLHLASTMEVEAAKDLPLPKLARTLGVNLIIRGMIQGTNERIRVTMSLVDMTTGRSFWSRDFTGTADNIIVLEDQIYEGVSSSLVHGPIYEGEQPHVGTHPTENVTAYDLYLQGRNKLHNGHSSDAYRDAVDLFEKAIDIDPKFALAYTGLADASIQMWAETKESVWAQKATTAAQHAKELSSDLLEVHISLGRVYLDTGQNSEAVEELKRALELAPNSDEVYRNLGHVYRRSGQSANAIAAYQKATDANPYNWENHIDLGKAYLEIGDTAKASPEFQKVTKIAPDNPIGYLDLGSLYLREGKWSESIPEFRKALSLAPDSATYSNLGTAYFGLKDYDQAIAMYEKAVQMTPNDEIILGNLGDAYRWSGHSSEAATAYDKAISLAFQELHVNPRSAPIMGDLALLYAKKGNAAIAFQYINEARVMTPDDLQLLYSEVEVKTLVGQPAEALKALQLALQKGYPAQDAFNDPELQKLRGLPKFAQLLEKYPTKMETH